MKPMILILPIFLFSLMACGHKQIPIPPPEIRYEPQDDEDTDVACVNRVQKYLGKYTVTAKSVSAKKKQMKELIAVSHEACKR